MKISRGDNLAALFYYELAHKHQFYPGKISSQVWSQVFDLIHVQIWEEFSFQFNAPIKKELRIAINDNFKKR